MLGRKDADANNNGADGEAEEAPAMGTAASVQTRAEEDEGGGNTARHGVRHH